MQPFNHTDIEPLTEGDALTKQTKNMESKELKLENVLDRALIAVLEENHVTWGDVDESRGQYCVELEFYSLHDGDQIVTLWFDKENANDSFAEALEEYWDGFDVDEYVTMWLSAKSERPSVCSLSARQLVEDGEDVDKFLSQLSDQINAALKNVPTETAVVRLIAAIKRGRINAERIMKAGCYWGMKCIVEPLFCSYGQIGYTFRFAWCSQVVEWDYDMRKVTLNGIAR